LAVVFDKNSMIPRQLAEIGGEWGRLDNTAA
jgi:hypothetical protein